MKIVQQSIPVTKTPVNNLYEISAYDGTHW
jgi:hypothetical protein